MCMEWEETALEEERCTLVIVTQQGEGKGEGKISRSERREEHVETGRRHRRIIPCW